MRLEEKHDVVVRMKYINDSCIRAFIDYIGDDLKQQLSSEIVKAKFYSMLRDGSIDANTIKNELSVNVWRINFCFVVTENFWLFKILRLK